MGVFVNILLVCSLHNLGFIFCDVRLPPSIYAENEERIEYASSAAQMRLTCEADGYPPPQYEWYKDGSPLTLAVTKPNPNSGSVIIEEFSDIYNGYYQCHASNKHGKAISKKVMMTKAFIGRFLDMTDVQPNTRKRGEGIVIKCRGTPKTVPEGSFSWMAVESLGTEPNSYAITMSRRRQVDDDGNLVISALEKQDELNGWMYRCNTENSKAGNSAFGSYTTITVTNNTDVSYSPTILSYTHDQAKPIIALKREELSLRCLFAGLPAPSVSWTRAGGKPFSNSVDYEQFRTVLKIKDVRDSDEGIYTCTATNDAGTKSHEIQVEVEAAPVFINNAKPMDMNATDGDDVVFACQTEAEPPAEITWYKNGKILQGESIPPRVTISGDRTTLRVSKVCKECKNGESDLAVFTCEAENPHGAILSTGYMNVLNPTILTLTPQDHQLSNDEGNVTTEVTFVCTGTTDESTPLKVKWLKDGTVVEEIADEIQIIYTEDGSVLHITANEDVIGEYVGTYTCVLTNEYSTMNASALLQAGPNDPDKVTEGGLASLWWVFLIVGILLLLLLLLLCCCLYLNRNKGDEYDVDEKERMAGFDPEAETENMGYEEYRRPEVNPVKGSRASLNSTMKLDDDASLAPYGDMDAGVFSEDGSFLGQYNTVERRQNTTHF